MQNHLESCLDNYFNGNLTEAKKQARRINSQRIFDGLKERGYGNQASMAIQAYLKGFGSFQESCDAELAHRG